LLFPQNFALRVIEIESYLRSPFLVWKHRLQKMIISDDFDKKYIRIFLPIVLLLITLDFILIFFGIKLKLWLLYGSINIIWWITITWRTYYTTTQKKPSE